MRARDVMSSPVVCVRAETTVRAAADLVTQYGFAALPVLDEDERIIGIVSEGDLLRDRIPADPRAHLRRDEAQGEPPPRTVGEVMTTCVIAMTPGADAADLAQQLVEGHVRSIPIVDGATVVGIVSRRDLLRTLVRDDDMIAAEVRSHLREFAGTQHPWEVEVADGVVTISGECADETDRRVAQALARTVPGVVRAYVRDRRGLPVPGCTR